MSCNFNDDISEPFHDDALDRMRQASQLTIYLNHLKEGAVLAIDAPWGEGKTWFGCQWARSLKKSGHQVIYIDAFEQDYIDDPFLLIAAEINSAFPTTREFKKTTARALKILQPGITKKLLNLAGGIFLGNANLVEEVDKAIEGIIDDTAEETSKLIEKKLDAYVQEKETLNDFKEQLAEIARVNGNSKPVIIFIDELDRCRPNFAVQLIERIKHLFNVRNLVFVLLSKYPPAKPGALIL